MAHAIRTGCAACRSVARSFSWTGTQPPWSRAHALVRISLLQGAVAAAAGGRGRHHLLRQTHVSKRLPAACKAPVSYRQGGKDRRAARAGRTEQWREQVGNQSSESVVCVRARANWRAVVRVHARAGVQGWRHSHSRPNPCRTPTHRKCHCWLRSGAAKRRRTGPPGAATPTNDRRSIFSEAAPRTPRKIPPFPPPPPAGRQPVQETRPGTMNK